MNNRIKMVRKDAGETLTTFGEKIGISFSAVGKIEKGVNNPSEQTIKSICHLYNINENWLRTGEGDPFPETTDNIVQFAAAHPDMSDVDKALMEAYFDLSDEQKDGVLQYCLKVAEAWNNKNNRKVSSRYHRFRSYGL